MDTYFVYNTPAGRITLASDGDALTHLYFGPAEPAGTRRATALTNTAADQLLEYLAGKRTTFDVALHPQGSDFRESVWDALRATTYGTTVTTTQLAASIGHETSARAVGAAVNANPIPIIIPCHRVVPASGGVGSYAHGVHVKEFLLNLEQGKGI